MNIRFKKKQKKPKLGKFLHSCNISDVDPIYLRFVDSVKFVVRPTQFDSWRQIPHEYMNYRVQRVELGSIMHHPVVSHAEYSGDKKYKPMYVIYLISPHKGRRSC